MTEQSSAEYRGALGRYALFGEIAAGGMATVHLARLLASVGFARTVAIKRLHPHLAKDPDFVAMFLEEARLAARVRHPNVVATLDVVQEDKELFLVMEYVAGESLSRLVRKTREAGTRIPPRFVVAIICAALEGLHAAHEATSERGVPLGIVHRDVSPQNIHVGIDGVARVLDFGIAKATNRVQETRTDQIKGKVAYMSPEQLARGPIDRRADVYSASVVLWEALTGMRLFKGDDVPSLVYSIINDEIQAPSTIVPDLPAGFDAIVMKGLDREASNRWSSAREMAVALEKLLSPAAPRDIGEWVEQTGGEALAWRLDLVQRIERETSSPTPFGILHAHPRHSHSSPIEVSGVAVKDGANGDATSEVRDVPGGHVPADPSHTGAEDDEDKRETLMRANPFVFDSRTLSPTPPVPEAPLLRRAERPRVAVGPALLATLLLLAGGGLLAFRLFQLQSEVVPTAPPPADSSEPAISLGISRTASAAPVSPPGAKGKAEASARAASPPVATTTNDCEPPFTVDAKGVRHPKPHCSKR